VMDDLDGSVAGVAERELSWIGLTKEERVRVHVLHKQEKLPFAMSCHVTM
jgi:hypothetical protein